MSPPILPSPSGDPFPRDADLLALLDVGLRPATAPQAGAAPALSAEEVGAMLPAYEVQRQIGQGGMGTVFAAVQRDLQRRVAIKLLSPALAETPGLAARFRHESRLMASLVHPGVVQVFEAGETAEGHLYYVMEFVDGEDLATRMHRGPLPLEEAVPLIVQVAEALQAAHALGIVHRDVKPANIFLSGTGQARLGDFGLALTAEQAAEALRLTRAGTTVGTVEYAAPEQLSRAHPVSAASDVYSLGVLAYEVFTGELPRGNFDPPSLRNPEVDAAFDSVVLRALQTDPARRYTDAGEFREAFLHAADRRRQQELRDEAVRRKMLRRTRTVAALTAVSLITGGSALLAWRARHEADTRRAAAETAEQRLSGLLQFMLTDLRQRLEPTGNLGAMESVLEKAVEHFRRQYDEAGQAPEAALKLADVLVTKADVIGVRGLKQEADALYTEALALTESARAAAPLDHARNLRVIQALLDRSEHRMAAANYPGALADARLMLRETEALAQRDPGPAMTRWRAVAHRAIANAQGYTDELEEAHAEYLRARTLLNDLATAEPGNDAYAYELASLDMSLGSNAEARGDLAAMLQHFTAWNDYVTRREGKDSNPYSHSAFRMGVALLKLDRAAEAVPYLSDAVRIAERDAAKLPGHKGSLHHVSWCVRYLAQAHEALGNTAEAEALRGRGAEVNAQLTAAPETEASTVESDFARLAGDSAAGRELWWAFCQRLQRAAEALPDNSETQRYYGQWISRTMALAPETEAGRFIRLVPAFLHNRLADLLLEEDPARSGQHAQQALALREGVAAAHPDEPELQRDVISSACHAATAAVSGDSAEAAAAALQKVAACARQLSDAAAQREDIGLFYAERSAVLLEYAASRWPDRATAFHETGTAIAAALLDRQPPGIPQAETASSIRRRLAGQSAPPEK